MKVHSKCCIAFALLALSGCASTPNSVHELAGVTSANVGVLGARLKQVADESNRLYARRVENVAQLHADGARARAEYSYDLALTKKSGDKDDLDLIKELDSWVSEVDKIFAESASAEKERREALLSGQVKIDTKTQALQKVAESLSTLAKEETRAERMRALQKFASEVSKDVKKELDSGSDSAKAAKKLLDDLSGK
jgi:ribosomal protein L17